MSLAAALRGFFGRMSPFSFPVVFVAVVALAYRWFMENVRMAFAKRERPPELAWYVRKVAEFFSRHPSLAVSSPSEFFFLSVRCAVYGALLSLLILELMIVVWFAAHPPFCVDSFVGEKFWRVLSADVERKKLADPIGAIDELMLQSNGNPGRHLVCIYGHKYLGDASDEEADRLAEETSVALQRMLNVELKRYSPLGREGFRRGIYSRLAYAVVEWDDNFFQKEKVLRLEVGWDSIREYFVPGLTASEVLGYKIGVPVSGDGKPRKPFWKFESVVNQCGKNNIVDAVYAVHDVSDLSLEEATREFEEARKAVEGLHGITMFKMTDYDDVKRYDCEGEDVLLSVRMEYLRKKQIRYSVHAIGNWWHQIRKMNPGASRRRMRTRSGSREAFWLCISVFCGGLLLLVRKRRGRKCAV